MWYLPQSAAERAGEMILIFVCCLCQLLTVHGRVDDPAKLSPAAARNEPTQVFIPGSEMDAVHRFGAPLGDRTPPLGGDAIPWATSRPSLRARELKNMMTFRLGSALGRRRSMSSRASKNNNEPSKLAARSEQPMIKKPKNGGGNLGRFFTAAFRNLGRMTSTSRPRSVYCPHCPKAVKEAKLENASNEAVKNATGLDSDSSDVPPRKCPGAKACASRQVPTQQFPSPIDPAVRFSEWLGQLCPESEELRRMINFSVPEFLPEHPQRPAFQLPPLVTGTPLPPPTPGTPVSPSKSPTNPSIRAAENQRLHFQEGRIAKIGRWLSKLCPEREFNSKFVSEIPQEFLPKSLQYRPSLSLPEEPSFSKLTSPQQSLPSTKSRPRLTPQSSRSSRGQIVKQSSRQHQPMVRVDVSDWLDRLNSGANTPRSDIKVGCPGVDGHSKAPVSGYDS